MKKRADAHMEVGGHGKKGGERLYVRVKVSKIAGGQWRRAGARYVAPCQGGGAAAARWHQG
jgi:hypothetical protein